MIHFRGPFVGFGGISMSGERKNMQRERYNVSYIGRGFSGHWEIADDKNGE